ncbi:MAG: RnfABCDGE type electron transport complex subunit D [Candidatus Eisenbacteria bacterium]|uniref:Ion-translocating oxidoreductase complex subunit D n=1 Tax=Eiseniibacteriota bacterium TaxID=2212470 RepID=A0A956N8G3_UNCEI|nr:RnfABCDGE type electron transport complex subunit D [Candidatus Eisenbacteria bacterium]MCB9462265.1 RnfABCDGE type electron transport complex subunit D [Candidatus Eisenbacteria bacterium]
MTTTGSDLVLQSPPFDSARLTTPKLMQEVTLATVPVLLAAVWFFGITALFIVAAACAGAMGAEWLFGQRTATGRRGATLGDGTALLTGVLMGLTLPPTIPLWMAFVGGLVGIGIGKLVWGGLGGNIFNPALVGRAFLQAAFPTALTTWRASGGADTLFHVDKGAFAIPFASSGVDAVTTATALSRMKFDAEFLPWLDLLRGNVAGSLGETSAGILILCGIWMGVRRLYDWRVPVTILVTVAVLGQIFHFVSPEKYPDALFMLFSGGLLYGAVFMATDPATSPTAPRGALIFGAGIGVLVVLIRLFGGLPEGVMYAILLMNATTPLIERVTQPRIFGR